MSEREQRLSWFERQQEKFLRIVRENPEREARLKKSWAGRLMLRTAERAVDAAPEVDQHEHITLRSRAERITIMGQITPGQLVLTDSRLIFHPVFELSWIPWIIRTSEMQNSRIQARKGVFLSRGIWMKNPLYIGGLPGWFHFANLKVKHGRRAWWLRVEDPRRWAAAISSASEKD